MKYVIEIDTSTDAFGERRREREEELSRILRAAAHRIDHMGAAHGFAIADRHGKTVGRMDTVDEGPPSEAETSFFNLALSLLLTGAEVPIVGRKKADRWEIFLDDEGYSGDDVQCVHRDYQTFCYTLVYGGDDS